MNSSQAAEMVKAVLAARAAQHSPEQINRLLLECKVAPENIPALIESINQGYRHGVSVALRQATSDEMTFGNDAVFDEAYKAGFREFAQASQRRQIIVIAILLMITATLALAAYLLFDYRG
jgi:hypothetical protein